MAPPGGIKNKPPAEIRICPTASGKTESKIRVRVREAQFLRYIGKALRSNEPSGQVLLPTLERRHDNVIYRLGFARTRLMERHLVSYGHVLLKANGRIVGLPNRDEIGMEIDESLIVEFYSR